MPIRTNDNLMTIRQKQFAQRVAAYKTPDSAKPVAREYIDPMDEEATISAAQKRDSRMRAQRPSTPPKFDSPLSDLCLDSDEANLSRSFYDKTEPNSFVFFSSAVQENQAKSHRKQACSDEEVDMAQSVADTAVRSTLKQPVAQGGKVSVIRQLKRMPGSFALDTLASDAEDAELVQLHKSILDETKGHFSRTAVMALRRLHPRPNALNPVEINTEAGSCPSEPLAPRAPRKNTSFFKARFDDCSVSDTLGCLSP